MTTIVRKAKLEDANTIYDITKEAFKIYAEKVGITTFSALTETLDNIQKDIETKEVLIACQKNSPVGCVRVEINNDNTAYISRLAVRSDFQKAGIGRTLIEAVHEKLKNLRISKVYLHTASKHKRLVIFYYSLGFYVVSTSTDKGYIRALMCKEY